MIGCLADFRRRIRAISPETAHMLEEAETTLQTREQKREIQFQVRE